MRYRNNKARVCAGLTLIEMVIAMAIMVVVLAVIVPQFRAILSSWDSKAGAAETLQNGRVLIDHLNRNLSKAVKITDISASSEPSGYIEFEDNDGNTLKYDVDDNNYVEFGLIGSLYELAGPVSQFQFTCYDACDFNTPLRSPIDVNIIRLVKVETILTNLATLGQDRTFTASVYLRTNWQSSSGCDPNLVGWWKLDETSGLTAADSSGNGNDGNLVNMTGDEWTDGAVDGALEFDGSADYVDCGNPVSLDITGAVTLSVWVKTSDSDNGEVNPYVTKGNKAYSIQGYYDTVEFFIYDNTWFTTRYSVDSSFNDVWHHLAGTYDGSQVKLYIDGELKDTEDHTGSINSVAYNVNMGRNSEYTDCLYDGLIDDVRIYNRALSAEEVAELALALRYRSFTETKVGSGAESITISTPDTNEGDLLIAAVATDGSTTISPPSGWTPINCGTYSSAVTLGAWWKLAGASEPNSHQFTWSGAEQAYGWMMRFSGHNSADPIDVYSSYGESSSTPTSPAVTTAVTGSLILRLGAFDDDDITVDAPGLSGHTAITMDKSAATGGQVIFESYAEASSSGNATLIDVSKPLGTGEGDLLIANFVSDGSSTLSAPGGWTPIRGDGSSTPSFGVWYKIAGASEPSTYTFTSSASEELYIALLRYAGHDPSTPINASDIANSTSSTPTAPEVTTIVDNCKILRVFGADDDDTPYTSPGGHTERYNGVSTGAGPKGCGGAGADTDQASAGATGTAAFSQNASEEWRAVTIAIAPVVVTGGTVSGGAGYVKQSSAGSSGTSTFTLGSSNEAQMLTIAIVPAPDSGGDCEGGQILP